MDNRFPLVGTIVEIEDIKQLSQYLRKRPFKIRFSDTDFAGKVQERNVKFDTINAGINILEPVRLDDLVKVEFYVEGRDVVKEDKILNFTSLIAYNIEIISSTSRDTQEDKDAVHTDLGRVYKLKEASEEELARNMVPLDDVKEPATTTVPDDPFAMPETKKEYHDLPF